MNSEPSFESTAQMVQDNYAQTRARRRLDAQDGYFLYRLNVKMTVWLCLLIAGGVSVFWALGQWILAGAGASL